MVAVVPALGRGHARYQGVQVDGLVIEERGHPSRRSHIHMRVARSRAARADAGEGDVASTCVDRRSRRQAKVERGVLGQPADHLRAVDDGRKVLGHHAVHSNEPLVPALLSLSRVVEEGGEGGIRGPDDPARAARHEIVIHVQPTVRPAKDLGLVGLDPLILPEGIPCAHRSGMVDPQVSGELD